MLNTIYEEFDLQDRIKDLQNKKIKIKRVRKNNDNASMRESSLLSDSSFLSESIYIPEGTSPCDPHVLESIKHPLKSSDLKVGPPAAVQTAPDSRPSRFLKTNNKTADDPFRAMSVDPNTKTITQIQVESKEQQYVVNNSPGRARANQANLIAQRKKEKAQNPMFYSSVTDLPQKKGPAQSGPKEEGSISGRNPGLGAAQPTSYFERMNNHMTAAQQQAEKERYIEERKREKSKNQMFMSQSGNLVGGLKSSSVVRLGTLSCKEEVMLPKNASKMIDDETKNISDIGLKLAEEKRKVDREIDTCLAEITSMFNEKRKKMHDYFDQYIQDFRKNYNTVKSRVNDYKAVHIIGLESYDDNIMNYGSEKTQITRLSYHDKAGQKIKEEPCRIVTQVANIDREIKKKMIGFLAEELNKQLLHTPSFLHGETAQTMNTDLRSNITSQLNEYLENLGNLIYKNSYRELSKIEVVPEISSVTCENFKNAVGNYRESKKFEASSIKIINTDHTASITAIQTLGDGRISSASRDGSVKLWNIHDFSLEFTLAGAHDGAVNCLTYIEASPGDLYGTENILVKLLKGKNSESNEKYVVSGGADGTVCIWDLIQKKIGRVLNGHKAAVTAVIAPGDNHTIISSSLDNTILVWDAVVSGKVKQTLIKHSEPVNCLMITKDKSFLISGGNDRVINIWRIEYVFSIPYQRKVVDKVSFETCLFDTTFVTSLNMSQVNCNVLFTGGNDSKIKVWNLKTGVCEREFSSHTSAVADMIVVENLYEYSSNKNYFVFSLSTKDNNLSLSVSKSKEVAGFDLKRSVASKYGEVCSPCMQILPSDKNTDGLRIVLPSESEGTNSILVVNLK